MSYIKPYNRQFNQYNKQFNQSKNRSFNKQYNKSCNKIDQLHQIYSNQKIKQILIDYIYDNTNIRLYNYKILSSKNDLNLIKFVMCYKKIDFSLSLEIKTKGVL